MDLHENARSTPHSRAEMVRRVGAGQSVRAVAAGFGVCEMTVRKWMQRFAAQGEAGLIDRSSRPHRLRAPTAPAVIERVVELRRRRMLMAQIAKQVSLSKATIGRLLSRAGLSSLRAL